MSDNQFYEIRYPSSRQFTFDVGRIGRGKHHVKALLEVDITEARTKIKQNRQSGQKASVTAWLIKVIADCVALHPPVSGINRPGGNKVVVFGEVDISLENFRLLASLAAITVAWRTKSAGATIVTGIVVLAVLTLLLN